jgi:hypothetical protein
MSKALAAVGSIASIAAMIPGPHQPFAQAISVVANVGSAILAKPPPAKGSVNQVQIGANMPSPYAMGRTYTGGNMVLDVGYGGSTNPYKSMALVWSSGGTTHSIEAFQGDFSPLTFSDGNAVGYYNNFLYLTTSLGTAPQSAALSGPFGAIPGWGATAKISGKTHGLITLKFDKKGKRFASGIPQFGVVLKGELAYDPRLDSTYPGGSGSHRFDDETTWAWTENPALHAIAYARGRYQNDKKVFGCGYPEAAINLPAFVAHANVCDANSWKVGGVIYEPGSRKDNLKYILEAGGAEPVFGAKLSVRYVAPKVALDTITAADLADGDYVVPAMRSWRERINGIIPKYRSEAHKWEYVQSDVVSVEDYVTEDGEEKQEERQFNLVQDMDQASQLAAYALVNAREFGPIVLPCKPRLSGYLPGEALEIDIPELGLNGQLCEITQRDIDPGTGVVTLTLVSETDSKHAFALGQSGTAPPTPTITAPDVIDELIGGNAYRSTPHVVADEAAMIALDAVEGEVAIRTDLPSTFIHNGGTTGTAADWTEALSPTYSNESAQDAVGAMVDASLVYVDSTPLLQRAALTGDVTASAGSNALTLATVNSNTGTYGGMKTSPQFSVNGKGLVTGVSAVTIQPDYSSVDAVPTSRLLGRSTAGTGFAEALTAAQVKTLLSLVPGTDVQAFDAQLAAIAGLTPAADQMIYWTGATTAAMTSLTASGRTVMGASGVTGTGSVAFSASPTFTGTVSVTGNFAATLRVYADRGGSFQGSVFAIGARLNQQLEVGTLSATEAYLFAVDRGAAGTGGTDIQLSALCSSFVVKASAGTVRMTVNSTGADIVGEARCDTLRIDVTPTAATPTPTHTVPINLNGTVYRIPCVI